MKTNFDIWKRMTVWSILLVQATSFLMNNAGYSWSYPVKEIAKPSCKADHRSKLPQECKIALPIIAKANYSAYTNNQLMRLVYSVLRGGTYSDGRANTKGSHEGIDITSSEGTPIYAIGDGVAIRAGNAAGYGKLVTLKHTLPNGSTIQSVYGHLETVTIQNGDTVKEGQLIGTMGHEGFAQGNHLHFAINTTKDYTYTFNGCLDYPKTSDYAIVEQGLCRELLFSRTIDPIAFIESQGLVPTVTSKIVSRAIKKPIAKVQQPATKPQLPVATKPVASQVVTPSPRPQQSGPTAVFTPSKTKASEKFLQKWTVSATPNFAGSLKKGSTTTLSINVVGVDGKKFAGMLDKELTMTPSKQNMTLSPRVIRYVNDGKVISFVEARETGTSDVVLSYGNDVIGTMKIVIE